MWDTNPRRVRAAIFLFAGIACSLGGCDTLQKINPPDANPNQTEIVRSYQDFIALMKSTKAPTPGSEAFKLTPQQYVRAGYRFVDIQCDEFFNQLANGERGFNFTKKEALLGISTTSATLALVSASAKTLALVATGGVFASQTLDNAEDYILLTKYQAELKSLVDKDRTQYKSRNKNLPEPDSDAAWATADDWVRGYANRCTISTIEQEISQTISKSEPRIETDRLSALGVVAVAVQDDLKLEATPTDDEILALKAMLASTAATDRTGAKDDLGARAQGAGIYWAKDTGALTQQGKDVLALINSALGVDASLAASGTKGSGASAFENKLGDVVGDVQAKSLADKVGTPQPTQNLGSGTPVDVGPVQTGTKP